MKTKFYEKDNTKFYIESFFIFHRVTITNWDCVVWQSSFKTSASKAISDSFKAYSDMFITYS